MGGPFRVLLQNLLQVLRAGVYSAPLDAAVGVRRKCLFPKGAHHLDDGVVDYVVRVMRKLGNNTFLWFQYLKNLIGARLESPVKQSFPEAYKIAFGVLIE